MDKTWQMINKSIRFNKKSEFSAELRIDDRYITDDKIIANAFNFYFSNFVGDKVK